MNKIPYPEKIEMLGLFEKVSSRLDASCKSNFESYINHLYHTLTDPALESTEAAYWQKDLEILFQVLDKTITDSGGQEITQLNEMFYRNLEFGTGGMRGIIGPGSNRINFFTIGKATQGFAAWLKAENPGVTDLSVVIAYDSRNLSNQLSEKSALILAGAGIKAYLFREVAPTPLLSFAVRQLKAQGGIVITASHNPREYNGYKVYRDDGCQVPPPKDKDIIGFVNREKSYNSIPKKEALEKSLLQILEKELDDAYLALLGQKRLWHEKGKLKIGYSALHGTGARLVPRVIEELGLGRVYVLESQRAPNGLFPTVEYPNPEEPKALELLLEFGRKNQLDIIMANDPDADRVGIGVLQGNDYVLLNGNQLGALLEYYILERKKARNELPANGVVIKTIVTTELQSKIAQSFGVRVIDTLTGFKYIGDWMSTMERDGSGTYIFGGEESYGYLPIDFVRDKDGIATCYFVAEAANYYATQGKTLLAQMAEIYHKHGIFVERLFSKSFPGKSGMQRMQAIMDMARVHIPQSLGSFAVLSMYDIQKRISVDVRNGKSIEDTRLPLSNVVQFGLAGGGTMTLRPSGTEPKIKFYFSINRKLDGKKEIGMAEAELQKEIEKMMVDFENKIINKAG
jgi:phosphoglucomutase